MTMMMTKAKLKRNQKRKKKERYHDTHKTMNLVNLSIRK